MQIESLRAWRLAWHGQHCSKCLLLGQGPKWQFNLQRGAQSGMSCIKVDWWLASLKTRQDAMNILHNHQYKCYNVHYNVAQVTAWWWILQIIGSQNLRDTTLPCTQQGPQNRYRRRNCVEGRGSIYIISNWNVFGHARQVLPFKQCMGQGIPCGQTAALHGGERKGECCANMHTTHPFTKELPRTPPPPKKKAGTEGQGKTEESLLLWPLLGFGISLNLGLIAGRMPLLDPWSWTRWWKIYYNIPCKPTRFAMPLGIWKSRTSSSSRGSQA